MRKNLFFNFLVVHLSYYSPNRFYKMKYEIATNQPAEDKAIIARIQAGETVYGAFLRGTGKIYMKLPIQLTTISEGLDAGKLALSAGQNTHNGNIQETFSRLICEWQPVCDRANEINRGAPMTDAEKAEMKRRRLIGSIAAGIEEAERQVILYTERANAVRAFATPWDYAVGPKPYGREYDPKTAAHVFKNEPEYFATQQAKWIANHEANAEECRQRIKKYEAQRSKI